MTVNMHEAKTHFSKLVKKALEGEEIIIAKSGTPLLKLSPINPAPGFRTAGLSRGAVILEDEFFEPLPEHIIEEFEK